MADLFPDNTNEYSLIAQRAAERKRLAQKMVDEAMSAPGGQMVGNVYAVNNPWGNFVKSFAGSAMGAMADRDISDALKQRQQAQDEWQQQFNAADTPEAKQQLLTTARNKGLRYDLEQQFAKQQQDAIEKGEQAAQDRVLKEENAQAQRDFLATQGDLNRQNKVDLRQMPATVVHVSQGRDAVQRGSDGKPLTASQEKAALELGSNRSNLQMLKDTFKDEYAGDLRSTIQRKFGEVAGGAAPEKTQEMTRWWANQAMFDELPQRHELFGATLTAGEKAAWASAAISPNMAPKQIRERLAIRAKIYDDAEARMRGSVEAGGKSVKQFDAATGKNAAKPTVVRTGTRNGVRVEQLSDGTIREVK